jgi:hypothetical protein
MVRRAGFIPDSCGTYRPLCLSESARSLPVEESRSEGLGPSICSRQNHPPPPQGTAREPDRHEYVIVSNGIGSGAEISQLQGPDLVILGTSDFWGGTFQFSLAVLMPHIRRRSVFSKIRPRQPGAQSLSERIERPFRDAFRLRFASCRRLREAPKLARSEFLGKFSDFRRRIVGAPVPPGRTVSPLYSLRRRSTAMEPGLGEVFHRICTPK